MEAIMALMVVTVAVMLLSLSFSLTAHDLNGSSERTVMKGRATSLAEEILNDIALWRSGCLVWSGLSLRSECPYAIPEGLNGYSIEVLRIDRGCEPFLFTNHSMDRDADDTTCVIKHALDVISDDGAVRPALLIIEVW